MKCKRCTDSIMTPGIALLPVWGRTDGQLSRAGDTLNAIASVFGPCMKCTKCGYSTAPQIQR